jgi:hypothetical protein
MNQVRVRRPNILKTASSESQTKIHIIKVDSNIHFIKSAKLIENVFPNQHARRSDGRTVLQKEQAVKVAGVTTRYIKESMTGDSSQAEDDSAVLKRATGVP